MTELELVSHETMAFMRGRYRLDELGNGRDELKFRQGRRTILTVYIHPDRYAFMLIFGRRERELFEAQRAEFPQYILDCYDGARTYPDGKWMLIDVTTRAQLEQVKRLILIKKRPNRSRLPVRARCTRYAASAATCACTTPARTRRGARSWSRC